MICFIHIEKAAGTTLHALFNNNFATYLALRPWHYWTNDKKNSFMLAEVKQLKKILRFSRGFGGHTARNYLGYENVLGCTVEYITFLREPVSRYISHYNFQKWEMNIDWCLDDFLEEKKFDNFMTKRIAGCDDINKARDNIKKQFSFVGIMEDFDTSLILMNQRLFNNSLNIYYEKKRSAPKYPDKIDLDIYIDRIREKNRLDIELYEYVRSTIFAQMVKEYGPDLASDLTAFTEKNKLFSYSPNIVKKMIGRLYLKIFRIYESKAHRFYHDPQFDYQPHKK